MLKRTIGAMWVVGALVGCGGRSERDGAHSEIAGASGTTGVGGTAAVGGTVGVGGGESGGAAAGGAGATGGSARPPDRPTSDLEAPALRVPENGRSTGSVWSERALRPRFAWDAIAGATSYDFELDDSCPATDFRSCDFPSPEWVSVDLAGPEVSLPRALAVSTEPPVGRRYFWRVRACESSGCSGWSSPRYLDVGRQQSDFDGNGYADVLVRHTSNTSARRSALVYLGPELDETVVLEDASAPEDQVYFTSSAEALGDVDADGFADLAFSAPGTDTGAPGRLFVVFGAADFGVRPMERAWRLDGTGSGFAWSVLGAGDVDADGRKDFVVGYYWLGPTDPAALLYRGSTRDEPLPPVALGSPAPAEGRATFSTGDVNGDGYSDVLVVRTWSDTASVANYELVPGGPSGAGASVQLGGEQRYPLSEFDTVGDVTGDGFSDLVHCVSVLEAPSEARVEVSRGGLSPAIDPSFVWGGGLPSRDSGSNWATLLRAKNAGDVNGDGFDDSVVGVRWDYSGLEQANLYLGGHGSRERPDAVYVRDTGAMLYVSVGVPRAVGDVNGDGFDDIFVNGDYATSGIVFFGDPELDAAPDRELSIE